MQIKFFFHTNFQPLFHPFRVKIFQIPFFVDVQNMKINICRNFTFLPSAVTALRASYLSQSVHVLFIYIDFYGFVYETIKHFRHMLEVTHFIVYTDHKPSSRRATWTPGLHLAMHDRHTTYIYPTLSCNVVANTLSRVDELQMPVSLEVLARFQVAGADLSIIIAGGTALHMEKLVIPGSCTELYYDVSTPTSRP